jgi:antitoxin Phd
MSKKWQLQVAKNKFSKVIDDALKEGPQVITRRGVQVAVVLSFDQFKSMKRSKEKLSDFFKQSPLSELVIERDRSPIRETGNL